MKQYAEHVTDMSQKITQHIYSFISFIAKSENGIDPFSKKYSQCITSKYLNLGKSAEQNELLAREKMNEINKSIYKLNSDYSENKNIFESKKRKYIEIQERQND